MNRILLILLLPLSAISQTTYPVLSTTTARTIVGGITNLPHLNSNNVFTGTGRWTGAVTLTNSGNVFVGDGSGLTGISTGVSTSGGSATNLSVYSSGTTNRPVRVFGTNGIAEMYYDKDGTLNFTNSSMGSSGGFIQFNSPYSYFDNEDFLKVTTAGPMNYSFAVGTGYGMRINQAGGFWIAGASAGRLNGSSPRAYVSVPSSSIFAWLTGTSYGETADLGIGRNAAGVLEVNSSTNGVYRDIIIRNVYTTNLYATNLVLNGGATVTGILSATASLNFDLTAVTVEDKTMTVTGAAVGDVVTLGVPNGSVTTSVQYTAWVSAADTVTVRARTSATGEDPASGTFRATVIKH
jgi:hypothetical protein